MPAQRRSRASLSQKERQEADRLLFESKCACDFRSLEHATPTQEKKARKRKRLSDEQNVDVNEVPEPKVDVRLRCEICKGKASFYCVTVGVAMVLCAGRQQGGADA